MRRKNHSSRTIRFRGLLALGLFLPVFALASQNAEAQNHVTGIKAVHRNGQTFITWTEVKDTNIRYHIYRHTQAINNADDLERARSLGEVGDASSMNASASFNWRTIRRTGMVNHSKYPVYYVIDESGPLADDKGLYVYTAAKTENAFYCVTPIVDSKERKVIIVGANATKASVQESVAPPQPVSQKKTKEYEDFVHWINDETTSGYKAMGRKAGIGYNFRVEFPTTVTFSEGLPLGVYLHGSTVNYNLSDPQRHNEKDSLVLRLDSPVIKGKLQGRLEEDYQDRGWYGHVTKYGKAIGERKQMNRVLWTIDWVEEQFKTDPERVSLRGHSMGGIGTLAIGLMNPDRFSVLHPLAPSLSNRDRNGNSINRFNPIEYIDKNPNTELPMILLTTGKTDQQFKLNAEFALRMLERNRGFMLYWDLRPHSGSFLGTLPEGMKEEPIYWNREGGERTPPLSSFHRNQSYPVLRNLSLNGIIGTTDFSVHVKKRPDWYCANAGDLIGTINGRVTWDRNNIVDTKNRYEITLKLHNAGEAEQATADVSIRRLQQFTVKPGELIHYRITENDGVKVLKQGRVKSDSKGIFTIAETPILKNGNRLVIAK